MHPLNTLIESQRKQSHRSRHVHPRRSDAGRAPERSRSARRARPLSAAYSVAVLAASLIVIVALVLV